MWINYLCSCIGASKEFVKKKRQNVLVLQLISLQCPKFIIFKIFPVLNFNQTKMSDCFPDISEFQLATGILLLTDN